MQAVDPLEQGEQLLFQRPVAGWARYRTPVDGLWLCASGAHPGGGIMGANGRLAALNGVFAHEFGHVLGLPDLYNIFNGVPQVGYFSLMDSGENILRFLELAPNVRYYTGFGQTEAMGVSGCPMDEKPGSAGKPTFLSKVALFDEYDNEVPQGTPGEICVRSPTVFLGYWGLEEDTAYTFRNGWHHTGDVGVMSDDGYVTIVDRKKDMIITGGFNVFPNEIEQVLSAHPAVQESAVIGVPDEKWGEAVKAVVVVHDVYEPSQALMDEIITFGKGKMAGYKCPKQVVFIGENEMPRTGTGKIQKRKLRDPYWEGHERGIN